MRSAGQFGMRNAELRVASLRLYPLCRARLRIAPLRQTKGLAERVIFLRRRRNLALKKTALSGGVSLLLTTYYLLLPDY